MLKNPSISTNGMQNAKQTKKSDGTPLSTVKHDSIGNQIFSSDGASVNEFMKKMGVKERELSSC